MTIGEKIKEERKKKNLTQTKLAEMSGISRTYLSDIESGRYTRSIKLLRKIVPFLECEIEITLFDIQAKSKNTERK